MEEIKKTSNLTGTEHLADQPQDALTEEAKPESELSQKEYTVSSLKSEITRIEKLIEKKQDAIRNLTTEIADLEQQIPELKELLYQKQTEELILKIRRGFDKKLLQPDEVEKQIFDVQKENLQPKRTRKKSAKAETTSEESDQAES